MSKWREGGVRCDKDTDIVHKLHRKHKHAQQRVVRATQGSMEMWLWKVLSTHTHIHAVSVLLHNG